MTVPRYRFSVIPAGAIIDARLKAQDIRVLALIGRHTDDHGWARRSQVKMARELGCSRGTVQGSIDRLVEAGYIDVQLEGRGGTGPDPDKQPFAAHWYRVLLDREVVPEVSSEPCEIRTDEPDSGGGANQLAPPGASPELARGANPELARGANPGVAPLEQDSSKPSSSKQVEREARARGREEQLATGLAKWPSGAVDDQARIRSAFDALPDAETEPAIEGIGPFLAELKRNGRDHVPALWKYLQDRAWKLLPAKAPPAVPVRDPWHHADEKSDEARALLALHRVAGAPKPVPGRDGYRLKAPLSARAMALAAVVDARGWADTGMWPFIAEFSQGHGAWRDFLGAVIGFGPRIQLEIYDREYTQAADGTPICTGSKKRRGFRAPWVFPPRVDGTLSPGVEALADAGGETLSDADAREFTGL